MGPPKPLPHVQRIALGYCLPACAQMALAQLGIITTTILPWGEMDEQAAFVSKFDGS